MQRINATTVKLNATERLCSMWFDQLLAEGKSCIDAADIIKRQYPSLDAAFIAWLTD